VKLLVRRASTRERPRSTGFLAWSIRGQAEQERHALGPVVLDGQDRIMQFRDSLADGKAQARTTLVLWTSASIETLEDVCHVVGMNACVAHADRQIAVPMLARDDHPTIARCVSQRVVNETVQEPLNQTDVAPDERQVVIEPPLQGDAADL
jgi:hypothetical protein